MVHDADVLDQITTKSQSAAKGLLRDEELPGERFKRALQLVIKMDEGVKAKVGNCLATSS